jgi:glutathione synthase
MNESRRKRRSCFLWITDEWSTLDHPFDSTLRLVEEAQIEGCENWWSDVRSIRWENNATVVDARTIEVMDGSRAAASFKFGECVTALLEDFTTIFYRPDPPVDLAYLHPLQLLSLGIEVIRRKSRVKRRIPTIVNPPGILLATSEKLVAAVFADLMPLSIVTSQWNSLKTFGVSERVTVLKPLHQAQSKGVKLLDWGDASAIEYAREVIGEATDMFHRPVMLQRYLSGAQNGEIRLWFLNGRLLGAAKKVPVTPNFPTDFGKDGSRLVTNQLARGESVVAARIARLIRRQGIGLAAVDLIDGKITDFNITSPGLLVEFENTLGVNLARRIVHEYSGHYVRFQGRSKE